MKNQYFGDINDYKKYGLLRLLAGNGKTETVVCWVLTEDDSGTDGRRIKYLEQPETWQKYDPVLYKHLRENVLDKGTRNIDSIECSDILPNCRFYSHFIRDDIKMRDQFFKNFLKFASGADLVFFDPDNGLEVKSVPRGRKKSSKYIYFSEIEESYKSGHSLLLYQHFPRMSRDLFIRGLVERFRELDGITSVFSYCSHHVVFLLISQPRHAKMFARRTERISQKWGDIIRINQYSLA